MTRFAVLLTALALTACSKTKEIDDPGMEAAGKQVGASSATMAAMPSDADEGTVTSNVQAVGGGLQSLVSQHQAYATANVADPIDPDGLLEEAGATDTVSWDGTRLVVNTSYDSTGYTFLYDVDLTFAAGGGGTTIDGRFNMDWDLDVGGVTASYTTRGTYEGLAIDSAGCAAGGSVTVDWDYDYSVLGLGLPGATAGATSGRVVVFYEGCEVVRIEGN